MNRKPITTLGDLMPAYDEERRAEIEREEARRNTPGEIAAREAKRLAEIEREKRQGLRDENGDWIMTEQEGDDETGEDDEE